MMRVLICSSLLVVLAVVVAEAAYDQQFQTFTRYGKRGLSEFDSGKQLFFTNSRYGKRAPGPMGNVARLWSSRPKGNVQPRADKFFINSRYGKRSPALQTGSKEKIYPELTEPTTVYSEATTGQPLICKYTGYNQLYHCVEKKDATDVGETAAEVHSSSEDNQSNE